MGQRLNIEIKRKNSDKVIANCYYHWSAYTESSLYLAKDILSHIIEYYKEKDDITKAIKLFQSVGSGLCEEDYNRLSIEEQKYCKIADNRNLGIISINEDTMQTTRDWEEGRITIELDDNDYKDIQHFDIYTTIDFDVYYLYDIDEFKTDYEEEIANGKINLDNIVELDINLRCMTIEDINVFLCNINNIENNGYCFKIKGDNNTIYQIIA